MSDDDLDFLREKFERDVVSLSDTTAQMALVSLQEQINILRASQKQEDATPGPMREFSEALDAENDAGDEVDEPAPLSMKAVGKPVMQYSRAVIPVKP